MKTIVLLDTSIGSTNKGDEIIMQAVLQGLKTVIHGHYVLKFPTHVPYTTWLQSTIKLKGISFRADCVRKADLKLVCGTNLLAKSMRYPVNNWNINSLVAAPLAGSVLVGVGNSMVEKSIDGYTRRLYNKVLSHEFAHSTRDNETTEMLKSMGFSAITTGCPTLWQLTEAVIRRIPTKRSDAVVLALTGSDRDYVADRHIIDVCRKIYSKLYFWTQTIHDAAYYNSFSDTEDIERLSPDVESYGAFLDTHDVDYVGTRLHGGIFAMQHNKRAIIVSIDNRARNIAKANHINVIERSDIRNLESMVISELKTCVSVDFAAIDRFRNQFN